MHCRSPGRALTPAHSAGRRERSGASGRHWRRLELSEVDEAWFEARAELSELVDGVRHAELAAALVKKTTSPPSSDSDDGFELDARAWRPSRFVSFTCSEWAALHMGGIPLREAHYVRAGGALFIPGGAPEGVSWHGLMSPFTPMPHGPSSRLPVTPSSLLHSAAKASVSALVSSLRSPSAPAASKDAPARRRNIATPSRFMHKPRVPNTGRLVQTAEHMITAGHAASEPPVGFVKGGAAVLNFGYDGPAYGPALIVPGDEMLSVVPAARAGGVQAFASTGCAYTHPDGELANGLSPPGSTCSPSSSVSRSSSPASGAHMADSATAALAAAAHAVVGSLPFSRYVLRRSANDEPPPEPPKSARARTVDHPLPTKPATARASVAPPRVHKAAATIYGGRVVREGRPRAASPRSGVMSRSPGGRAFFSARRSETSTDAAPDARKPPNRALGAWLAHGAATTPRPVNVLLPPLNAPRTKRTGAELTRRLSAIVA